MEFKGTKGEWKQRQMFENPLCTTFENGYECYHNEISIHDSNGRVICEVNYQTDTPTNGWGKNETIEKWKANAQLVASAPELLECMQNFVDGLDKGEVVNTKTYNKFKALIEKATKID
jgi:hypothetical protein